MTLNFSGPNTDSRNPSRSWLLATHDTKRLRVESEAKGNPVRVAYSPVSYLRLPQLPLEDLT